MNEIQFRRKLAKSLREELSRGELKDKYTIKEGENLIYKVIIDGGLNYRPDSPWDPRRGDYAFQVDILIAREISNGNAEKSYLPFVVIETKYGSFSTHDVLIYSTKALKHKEIYPYIRYGFVVGGIDEIYNKFFTHNVGFDFAFAMKRMRKSELKKLSAVIQEQLSVAEFLLDIFQNKKKVKIFNSTIKNE